MAEFSILLAPAEGKREGGNPFAPDMFDYRTSNTFNYFHELNPERKHLIGELQAFIEKDDGLDEFFGVKGENLERAIQANNEIYNAPLMSALDRYSPGVMYQAMDFVALPTGAQRRLLEYGIIFSGLFGLLRPDDLIPDYKLKMDATLPGIGKIGTYWRERMSDLLNQRLKGRVVWNLLPVVHQESWTDEQTYQEMILVKFLKKQKGELKPVTHGVKGLRGKLVNYIVRETVDDAELLLEWKHPDGYKYVPSKSTFDEESKLRTIVMVK